MFRWSPFPFLRLSILFIAGIILYEFTQDLTLYILLPLLLIFLIGLLKGMRSLSGMSGLLIVGIMGWINSWVHDPTHAIDHISNLNLSGVVAFRGIIKGNEVEKEKYYRYDFEIKEVLQNDSLLHASGLIHIYLFKDDDLKLTLGDVLFIDSYFGEIPQPKNPAEFNYSQYIKRSLIYGQAFVHANEIAIVDHVDENKVKGWSEGLRDACRTMINKYITGDRESQIAQALLIGIKDYLDQDVKTAYASVGAMHVLAVSGLHVGIIYLLLLGILKPLRLLPYGSYAIFVLLLLGIWFYAMVTGLSPSVMRAATMFSVVSLKEISIRRTNIYNSLGLAALVLLIYNPNFLFSVGFQLSFIAVFGIVYFHPKIYGLIRFESWLPDKIWSISCISIAAQLATFPLSMYYFNQFPVYFLISNLIVIPGAMVLLAMGLILILLGFTVPILATYFGHVITFLFWLLNEGIFLIDQLPNSLITGLYLSPLEVWLCYGVIIFLFVSIQYRSFMTMAATSFLFVGLLGSVAYRNVLALNQERLVFYEIPEKTVFDIISGKQAQLIISDYSPDELELLQYQIDPFRRVSILSSISEDIIPLYKSGHVMHIGPYKLFVWKEHRVLIIDQPIANYHFDLPVRADILLISSDAIRDLSSLTDQIRFNQLIISSDCSAAVTRRLLWQANVKQIPIHSLTKDGYWMLDLKQTQRL